MGGWSGCGLRPQLPQIRMGGRSRRSGRTRTETSRVRTSGKENKMKPRVRARGTSHGAPPARTARTPASQRRHVAAALPSTAAERGVARSPIAADRTRPAGALCAARCAQCSSWTSPIRSNWTSGNASLSCCGRKSRCHVASLRSWRTSSSGRRRSVARPACPHARLHFIFFPARSDAAGFSPGPAAPAAPATHPDLGQLRSQTASGPASQRNAPTLSHADGGDRTIAATPHHSHA